MHLAYFNLVGYQNRIPSDMRTIESGWYKIVWGFGVAQRPSFIAENQWWGG